MNWWWKAITKFKDLIDEEKPRERFLKYGPTNISNEDLISIILKTGSKDFSVKDVSNQILSEIESIQDLKDITVNKLMSIKGIGKTKAIELISAIELGRRVYLKKEKTCKKIKNPEDTFLHLENKLLHKNKEHFYVIYLDTKSNIIETKLLFVGGLNECIIDIREIFKHAHLLSAHSFICVHNHPSGDVTPSKSDDINTIELIKIGKLQKILLRDHIIIGNGKYYSYYENGKYMF